jgi:hypothetical protein
MPEIMTPPRRRTDKDGEEWVAIGPQETLSDIARWAMTNPVDGEELHRILARRSTRSTGW